jgi:D-inositol-3-phosphate glycosyltransferase
MPLVVLEAMGCRRAVVASNVGGLPEVTLHDETGLLVPSEKPVPLAEALLSLLAHPVRAAALGEAGRQRVEERFTWERAADRYLQIYAAAGAG